MQSFASSSAMALLKASIACFTSMSRRVTKKCNNCRRLLFAKDFKKHVDAVDMILGSLEAREAEAMSCMDLLLRWAVVRICDANTQCLLKVLDLVKELFNLMISKVPPPSPSSHPTPVQAATMHQKSTCRMPSSDMRALGLHSLGITALEG